MWLLGPKPSGRSAAGFNVVELMTLVALVGVLATLLASAMANARVRGQQTVCMANLGQVLRAIDLYTADTGKRPRSLTRVMQHDPARFRSELLICPSDPELRGSVNRTRATNQFWGNLANASQETWIQGDLREPESGSWTAELAETEETLPFSYLHPLGWRRPAWQRLAGLSPAAGMAVCQLHGVKVPPPPAAPGFKPYLLYEGQVFRAQRDGAVVKRRVFRPGVTAEGQPGSDYPWELYVDSQPGTLR